MTAHVAASKDDARLAAWIPLPGSADADLLGELPTIALPNDAFEEFMDSVMHHVAAKLNIPYELL